MSDIIVRIGAAQDRSIDAVFDNIDRRSARAFGAVRRESGNASKSMAADARTAAAEEKRAADARLKVDRDVYREQSRLNRMILAEQIRAGRMQGQEAARLSRERTRERLKGLQEEERAERQYNDRVLRMKIQAQREANRAQRAEERSRLRESYRQEREIDRFATRTSHRATRFFFPRPEGALGYTKRIAGDLMRGAGMDMSMSGGVSRAVERETAGMGLAQQERIATGKSAGGAAWSQFSRSKAEELKVAPEQITAMVRSFTGKTGAFGDVKGMVSDLGAMAAASGADLTEMGNAAGFVYNQLKGLPNAGQMTIDVLRGIIGQTAVGSVEMEDYAVQMGRIAANAQKFKGDTGENIRKLSALAQLAVASGGATGAADAARSVGAFVNTFGKEARISAFAKHDVNLFEDQTNRRGPRGKILSSGTIMRDPFEIIKDAIFKTKGDIPTLANMFADTLGRKPVTALANAWSKAGGGGRGGAGEKAIDAEIAQYMAATMDASQQAQNLADYHATTAAKAQDFQNKLDRVTESLASRLLPTLEQLAPKALELANTFSNAVSWAAGNPWQAVMALLGASVARAATESLGRLVIDRAMTGLGGLMLGGGGGAGAVAGAAAPGMLGKAGAAVGGAVSGGAGALANTAGLLAVATASFMITDAIINSANTTVQESAEKRARASNDIYQVFRKEYSEAQTADEREAAVKRAKMNLNETEGSRGFWDRVFGNQDIYLGTNKAIDEFVKSDFQKRMGSSDASTDPNAQRAQQEASMSAAFSQALAGKTINVNLVNPDDIKLSAEAPVGGGGFFTPATSGQ